MYKTCINSTKIHVDLLSVLRGGGGHEYHPDKSYTHPDDEVHAVTLVALGLTMLSLSTQRFTHVRLFTFNEVLCTFRSFRVFLPNLEMKFCIQPLSPTLTAAVVIAASGIGRHKSKCSTGQSARASPRSTGQSARASAG